MVNENIRSRNRFLHTCGGCRGVGMIDRRGINGGSTGVGLTMLFDGGVGSKLKG